MKLKQLQKIINQCVDRAGDTDPDVEVWFKKKMYDIRSIDQFGVVPDVTITIGEMLMDVSADEWPVFDSNY